MVAALIDQSAADDPVRSGVMAVGGKAGAATETPVVQAAVSALTAPPALPGVDIHIHANSIFIK